MPSQFEIDMAANLQPVYADFALPAAAANPDGTAVASISIRLHRNDSRQVPMENGAAIESQTGELMVLQADIAATALVKPVRNTRFTVEGTEVWSVETTPVLKNGQYTCTVKRVGIERLQPRRNAVA